MAVVHMERPRRETDYRAEPLCNFRGFVWERVSPDPEKVTCTLCLRRMAQADKAAEAHRVGEL